MKNLNKSGVCLLIWFAGLHFANAQGHEGRGHDRFKELESQRIAFLSQELALTPEEAKLFWPVYNQFSSQRLELMQSHRQARRTALENLDAKTQEELLQIAELDMVQMEEMNRLRRKFHIQFLDILPVKKVIRLYEAERRFGRELHRQHVEKRSDGPERGRR